jgi:hypothetical protein
MHSNEGLAAQFSNVAQVAFVVAVLVDWGLQYEWNPAESGCMSDIAEGGRADVAEPDMLSGEGAGLPTSGVPREDLKSVAAQGLSPVHGTDEPARDGGMHAQIEWSLRDRSHPS